MKNKTTWSKEITVALITSAAVIAVPVINNIASCNSTENNTENASSENSNKPDRSVSEKISDTIIKNSIQNNEIDGDNNQIIQGNEIHVNDNDKKANK